MARRSVMMMFAWRCRAVFLVVSATALVIAPTRAEAYRPFDGTDADVAELKVFELELGPVHYYRQANQNYLITPALVLNFGIFEGTELVIDADQFVALGKLDPGVRRESVLGDDILIKHIFREGTLQEKTGVSIAAEGGLLTPEIHGKPRFGGSLDIITSYRWSWATVHWNEWFEYNREAHADLFSGIIVEGPHAWTLRPVAEFFYDKDFVRDETVSVLLGGILAVNKSFAFDLGVRRAWTKDENAVEVRLGLTWAIGFDKEAEKGATTTARSRSTRSFE